MGISILAGILVKVVNVLAYLDHILSMSPDVEAHINVVHNVLLAFEEANILLTPRICQFATNIAKFFGFTFTAQGIQPSGKHVAALKSYVPQQNIKDLLIFLLLVNFF